MRTVISISERNYRGGQEAVRDYKSELDQVLALIGEAKKKLADMDWEME